MFFSWKSSPSGLYGRNFVYLSIRQNAWEMSMISTQLRFFINISRIGFPGAWNQGSKLIIPGKHFWCTQNPKPELLSHLNYSFWLSIIDRGLDSASALPEKIAKKLNKSGAIYFLFQCICNMFQCFFLFLDGEYNGSNFWAY